MLLLDLGRQRSPASLSTDEIKLITCAALDEARRSGGFALYAYVIMPDHLHVVTDSLLSASRTLQFIMELLVIAARPLLSQSRNYRWVVLTC